MENNKLYVFLIAIMILAAFMPITFGATEDSVLITFDPDGNIDIDISHPTYDFGSFVAETWSNSTNSYFTLYNNGTVAMDTDVKSNDTTDEGDMKLNETSSAPGLNEYSIKIIDMDQPDQYVNNTYGHYGYYDTALAASGSETFGISLYLGTISANHTGQNVTIYFQGSQAT